MARIAFLHNALGKTDGVSLEVDKWRAVLEELGHTVFLIAGNEDCADVLRIPELSFYHKQTQKEIQNATVCLRDYQSGSELLADIERSAEIIKARLYQIINENKIDIIIPNNLMSVGYHIAALKAVYELIKETGIKAVCHNHDFYFEDSGEVEPTCNEVMEILEEMAPPHLPNVINIVINQIAKKELFERKHIESEVVPNVFDFDMKPWTEDEYNRTFLQDLNISRNDLIFLQATRVMNRKGIELAIDVVGALNRLKKYLTGKTLYNGKVFDESGNIILLCAGIIENFGISSEYVNELEKRAKDRNVMLRFIGDRVAHSRAIINGEKIYSLWDSYVYSDFVTYPSIWEGFGNQFIEAVFAGLPIVAFEYPVYISDLKDKGFHIVSLGNEFIKKGNMVYVDDNIIKKAAEEAAEILLDERLERRMAEENYNIAARNYSYKNLKEILKSMGL